MICLDVDGTLVDDQGRIHPRDVDILTTDRRVTFVLATGRLLPSVRRTLERNRLFADRLLPMPLVLQNGAALYAPEEALCAHYPFSAPARAALIEAMEIHRQVAYLLFTLSEVRLLWPTPLARGLVQRFDLDARPFREADRQGVFTKAMCISESQQALRSFADAISNLDLETAYSIPTVFEITGPGVTKGRGFTTLLPTLSLADPRILAVGDGGNDLPLFELADIALAPSTSPANIRDQANRVIHTEPRGLLAPVLEAAGLEPDAVHS